VQPCSPRQQSMALSIARSAKPLAGCGTSRKFSNQIRTDASSAGDRARPLPPKRRHTLFTMSNIEEPCTSPASLQFRARRGLASIASFHERRAARKASRASPIR
jgi:hypothetical protein